MRQFYGIVLLLLMSATVVIVQAQTQEVVPSLRLTSSTWDKSTLNFLIIEADSESWWRPEYTSAAINALEDWNQAIAFFSSKYNEYSYLSDLELIVEVSNSYRPGFDVYVNYTRTITQDGQFILGLATTHTKSGGIFDYCEIRLATTSESLSLNTNGIRKVATHELGHALGLSHSNSTLDLMYASNDLVFSNYAISTLDLYGVATVFDWMKAGTAPAPQIRESIVLPSNVVFEYAPTLNQTPNPLDEIAKIVQSLVSSIEQNIVISLLLICTVIVLILGVLGIMSKRKQRKLRTKQQA